MINILFGNPIWVPLDAKVREKSSKTWNFEQCGRPDTTNNTPPPGEFKKMELQMLKDTGRG